MTIINIWSDFICPDCLNGEKNLMDALKKMGLEKQTVVNYRACELKASPSSTYDAHRLMKYAQAEATPAQIEALNFALFEASLKDGLNLADHSVLIKAAESAGLDTERVNHLLNNREQFADQVKLDEEEARRLGVKHVPHMVFNDEFALTEVTDMASLEAAVRRAETLSDTHHKPGWGNPRVITPEQQPDRPGWEARRPGSCGPDGCIIESF